MLVMMSLNTTKEPCAPSLLTGDRTTKELNIYMLEDHLKIVRLILDCDSRGFEFEQVRLMCENHGYDIRETQYKLLGALIKEQMDHDISITKSRATNEILFIDEFCMVDKDVAEATEALIKNRFGDKP